MLLFFNSFNDVSNRLKELEKRKSDVEESTQTTQSEESKQESAKVGQGILRIQINVKI